VADNFYKIPLSDAIILHAPGENQSNSLLRQARFLSLSLAGSFFGLKLGTDSEISGAAGVFYR
jgi:hypothetical protein